MDSNIQGDISFSGSDTPGQGTPAPNDQQVSQVQREVGHRTDASSSFVTPDVLEARLNKFIQDVDRRIQSRVDRGENRIGQQLKAELDKLESRFAEIEAEGVKLPEAYKEEQRSMLIQDQLARGEPPQLVEVAGIQMDARYKDTPSYVNYLTYIMSVDTGIQIMPTDPEAELLRQRKIGGGEEYVKAFREAINAKAERLNIKQRQTSAGRIPAGGGSATESWENINDGDQLIRMGLERWDRQNT